MRDALRYRQKQKRLVGKSGDSGDEMANVSTNDESTQDAWELKDALSFLVPTSSKFQRKTTVLGAVASNAGPSSAFDPIEEDRAADEAYERRFIKTLDGECPNEI